MSISAPRDNNRIPTLIGTSSVDGVTPVLPYVDPTTHRLLVDSVGGGTGTVGTVSVVSANGFAGTVANPNTTPAITLTTTITGVLKGNGTAISAASDGTDYLSSTTGVLLSNVSTTATASKILQRDASANAFANNFIEGYTTTATAAGTTTLTIASTEVQVFTGTTTQTVVLPDATTLSVGHSFRIINNSTGLVTIQTTGGATLWIMAAATEVYLVCTAIGTTAGTWFTNYYASGIATGKKEAFANSLLFSGTDGKQLTLTGNLTASADATVSGTNTGDQTLAGLGGANVNLSNITSVQLGSDLVFPNDSVPTQRRIDVSNQTNSNKAGNDLVVGGANGNGTGKGGAFIMYAGDGGTNGDGGNVYLQPGYKGAGGTNNGSIYFYSNNNNGIYGILDGSLFATSNKTFTFPNSSGTFDLIDVAQTITGAKTFGDALLIATTPKITTGIKDANGNTMLSFSPTASAVDSIQFINAATANPATVDIAGIVSDSNINVSITPKGTGVVKSINSHDFSKAAYFDSLYAVGNSGTSVTINFANGNKQSVVRTGSATYTLQFPGVGNYVLKMIHENSSTAYTVTFSPVPKYPGGTAPTWTNTAYAVDIISFLYDVGTVYAVQNAAFS